MSLFDIDYPELRKRLIRRQFWTPIMLAWLSALTAPAVYLYGLFTSARSATLYKLAHGPQRCHLEAVLNDAFDKTLRRISIVHPEDIDPVYLPLEAELSPQPLALVSENAPLWLPLEEETVLGGPDFIVEVPAGLSYDAARMRALVDEYRLASKTYDIKTV